MDDDLCVNNVLSVDADLCVGPEGTVVFRDEALTRSYCACI